MVTATNIRSYKKNETRRWVDWTTGDVRLKDPLLPRKIAVKRIHIICDESKYKQRLQRVLFNGMIERWQRALNREELCLND